MRTELPECKRCCFCLPLRYGLITWGYIKLIAGVLMTIFIVTTLIQMIVMLSRYGSMSSHAGNIAVLSVVLALFLLDVAFNLVFVIGGHTKNVKLLNAYYIYNAVLLGLTVTLVVIMVFIMLPTVVPAHVLSFSSWLLLLDFSGSFVNIISQCYFLLLLRSEIIKLKNKCEFRFVNNAAEAEAECTMEYGERLEHEKGTEDTCSKGTCETEVLCEKMCHSNGTCPKNNNDEA